MVDSITNSGSILNHVIQNEPGIIVGPITQFLGYILNAVSEFAWILSPSGAHTLGIAIILLTIIVRALMLPLAMKQQKSMVATQRLMPEVQKIRDKYGNSKDKEIQQKIAMETQALYSKYKVNPLAGCLPALIQLPIFFALNYMIRQAYLFINSLGEIYNGIANTLINMPDYGDFVSNTFMALASPKVPNNMRIDLSVAADVEKVINKFSPAEWQTIVDNIPAGTLDSLLAQKESVEYFIGINLIEITGWGFPNIIIPILAVATTFLSSWLMMKVSPTSNDPNQKMMRMMTLYFMPLMMGYFTITFSAGVGIYWITLSVVMVVQQYFLNKYYKPKIGAKFDEKIVSVQ